MLVASAIAATSVAAAAHAWADVPSERSDRGDCVIAEGAVCHRTVGGKNIAGICYKSKRGEMFCAVDEDSNKQALEKEQRRAERDREETVWVTAVGAVCAAGIGAAIFYLRRKKQRASAD